MGEQLSFQNTGIAQTVQPLATGWTVRGSNPGGGEIFRTRAGRPWGLPSRHIGYRLAFPAAKRLGRIVNCPPRLAPRLKKEYICTSSSALFHHDVFYDEVYLYLTVKTPKKCVNFSGRTVLSGGSSVRRVFCWHIPGLCFSSLHRLFHMWQAVRCWLFIRRQVIR
jgi:hypothetical protein